MCANQGRIWISCVLFHEAFSNNTHKFRFVRMIDEGWRIPKAFYRRLQYSPPRHAHNERCTVECMLYSLHVSGYPKTQWNRAIILLILFTEKFALQVVKQLSQDPTFCAISTLLDSGKSLDLREHRSSVPMFVAKITQHNGFILSLLPGTD